VILQASQAFPIDELHGIWGEANCSKQVLHLPYIRIALGTYGKKLL